MKHCPYCGKEYSDDLEFCPSDNHPLQPEGKQPAAAPSFSKSPEYIVATEEKRFWSRMTFRQFAIVMLRIQALWLFINAVLDVIYIPRYILVHNGLYHSEIIVEKSAMFTLVLRILINIAGGFLIIQKAEKILSWMIRDMVAEQATQPEERSQDKGV